MATLKTIPANAVTERESHDSHARLFSVQSRTSDAVYTVSYFDDTTTRCSCPAGQCGRRCWHKSEVEKFIATQEAEEDARLEAIVGEWWHSIYGDMTAQEVIDAEEEREEAAFWQDFNTARETIISAVNVWLSAYQPKEQPMQETKRMMCLTCDKWHTQTDPKVIASLAPAFCSERCRQEWNTPRCKQCYRTCNGQTGLCYRCEEAQRKREKWMSDNLIREYTCQKCGVKHLLQVGSEDNGLCMRCELAEEEQQRKAEAAKRETAQRKEESKPTKSCAACGCDMSGKWAGAKYGSKKVLCMTCNRLGFLFTVEGEVKHKEVPPEQWPEVQARHTEAETRKAQACTRMAAHVTDDKAFSIFKS